MKCWAFFNTFASEIETFVLPWDSFCMLCCRSLPPGIGTNLFLNTLHITFRADIVCLNFILRRDPLWRQILMALTAAWFLGNCVQRMFRHLWWSGPETRRRHHGTAAEMPMLTPCSLLLVLVSVAMLCALRTLSKTTLHIRRELE